MRARPQARRRFCVGLLLAGAAVIFVGPTPRVDAASKPPLRLLLSRAAEHVRRFEEGFALVLSTEDYEQQGSGRTPTGAPAPYYPAASPIEPGRAIQLQVAHRRTLSDMLFVQVPDAAVRLTVRNVLSVDGQSVPDGRRRLNDAFGDGSAQRLPRLRQLADESARFNPGRTLRNYNYPTQVLSYLSAAFQPRFSFRLGGHERVGGVDAWKVTYEERATPTVIQGDGRDRRSRGTVWIREEDGAVVKTVLRIVIPGGEMLATDVIEVDYHHHTSLGLWVPVEMRETYIESRGSTVTERISGRATYTDYRRFETSGRVIEPQ